jgi:hypothetical protein
MLSGPEARVQASVVLAVVDLETGTPDEQLERLERAIAIIDRIALQVDDEIDRLSVLRMKESPRLLAGPARTGDGGGALLGLAAWDGTLLLDEGYISGPLQQMHEQPGAQLPPETLRRYRFALPELFHQQPHFLATEGASYADSPAAFADPAVRLLEPGVTAAWTRDIWTVTWRLSTSRRSRRGSSRLVCQMGIRPICPRPRPWPRASVIGSACRPTSGSTGDRGSVGSGDADALVRVATLDVAERNEPALQATSAAAGRASVDAGVETIETIRREYAAR